MSISRKFQRSKSKYTLSQKIISAVTAAGFIMQPFTAFAGQIVKPGGENLINNGVANIWADKVVDKTAINVFNKFNLSANEIANMYFGLKGTEHNSANLVNFVNDRIDINGTVNAIQNNKIGGNLFFLSKEGMAVGKSGVINTGSLYVMTPATGIDINSQEYNYTYEGLQGTFDSGAEANINTALNRMQALNIPLNAEGTISVLGKVNATGDVKMAAAKIGIGKNVSGVDLSDGTKAGEIVNTAVIKTAAGNEFNFADIVNIKDANGNVVTNAGLGSDLTAVESGNGDIVLAAKAEYANTTDQVFNDIGKFIGLPDVDIPKTIEASIESYGTITARGNAELTAEATNGNKDLAEEVLEETTGLETKIPDYVPVPAADAGNYAQTVAKVEVQGDITAGQDIKVAANADNTYVDNGQGIEDNVSNILQYITPVNANVMILGSKAEVNIGEEADLTAEGVIDVTANSVLDGTAGAAVNGRKLITVSTVSQAGSFLPSAAVGYADVENSAKVDIQGNLTAKGANKTDDEKAVNIAAYAEESVANTANLNISSTTSKPNNSLIAAAVAVTKSSNTADVIIGSGSIVNAEKGDVDITADTVNLLNANAASVAPDNTVGAAAVNVFSHDGHANIAIDGDITGQNVAIDATNLTDENTITANNELGMGKIQAQLVNAIDPDGLKNAVKNNKIVTDITTNIKKALGSSSSGDGSKTDITQVLSDKFEAGAAVVVTNENNSANVTFGKTAEVTAKSGDITADADVRVVDYSFTASGTSNSYKKSAADGTTTTVTVGAGVVYAGMDNEASVVFADGDGSGEEQHAELSAAGNINVNSSNIMEYNRPQRIFREIQRSIENIEYAIAAFDKLDEYQKQGMEEYRAGLENLKQSLKDYTTTYSNDFNETVKNPDAITAEGTMNKIYEMAAAAAVLYNQVVDLQTKYNTVQGSNELSAASAIISNSLAVVTNALAFADPNNYANVAAQASAKGGSESSKFAASGSVAVSDFSGTSGVKVGKYTKLEAGKDLNLESANEIEDVTITGKTMFWTNNADAKGGVGIGGSFNYQNFDTDSSVVVAEGTELTAGDIAIASDSNVFHVGAMLGAGNSDGSALSGMVSLTDSDSYNNVIVDTDAKLTANKDSAGNTGIISIDANNDTSVTNAIVTFSASGANAGVGMGVAINNIDVQNTAQIIDNDGNEDENDVLEGEISASELNVNAETTGLINSVSVAGGMTSSGTDSEEGFLDKVKAPYNKMTEISNSALGGINNISNKLQNVITTMNLNASGGSSVSGEEAAGTPGFSFAGAGSVSLNMVSDTTKAVVDGAKITLNNDGALQVGARDSAFTGAWSGAAGLSFRKEQQSQKSTSVAVSGAVGVNDIDNEITALVKDSTVTGAKDVDIAAVSGGTTVAAGLGATLTKDGGQGKNYSGGGSVSVNLLDKNVNANMEDVTLTGDESSKADIDVAAYESDVQVTGGVNANIALGGGSLVGGGVTVADINNNINAGITGGTYTNVDDVNVKGLLAVTQVTAALSAGIAAGGSGTNNAFGGAVVYNGLSNDITAGIDGAAITAGGLVNVMAKDTESSSKEAEPYQNLLGDYNEHNQFAADNGIDTTGSSYYTDLDTADEKVDYDGSKGSTIVGAAAVVTAGSNSNAGGAAVNIADIDNDFTAKINNANITAENVRAEADADTLIVNASGGVAAGTKSFGGMGSVTWQDIDNDLSAEIENSTITTNTAEAKAINNTQAVNVAGSVSYGAKAGIGATLAYNGLDNTVGAYMRGNTINALGTDVDVIVDADNTGKVYGIAAGVAASTKVAINGSVAVNRGGSNTEAIIDKSDEKESAITNAGKVNVTADDDTYRIAVVGQASVAGKAAVGGGVAYNDIGGSSAGSKSSSQNTTAAIKNTDITMADSGENTANVAVMDNSELNTIAVGVAAAANAGVQGSAATSLINKNTSAVIENTDIDEKGGSTANVTVDADNNSKITSSADTASVASQGAGVGAGVAVNRIEQQTGAAVNGGIMNVNNLTVNANGTPRIENIGIGIAVAGQGAGVTGSVSVNMIDNDVTAHIGSGANITADGSVGVVATSDEQIANYAGQAAVAGQGAGVGVSVAVNQIAGTTSATVGGKDEAKTSVTAKGKSSLNTNTFIRGYEYGYENKDETKNSQINNALISQDTVSMNTTINRESENRSGLVVDASSTRDMKSFLLTAGVGGMGAGVTGTVNVNMIKGATNAGVANTIVNGGSASTAGAGNVFVNAGDYTNMSGFVGSGGVGGIGAGVGLGSDTNTFSRNVEAVVENSDIKAKALEVDADSQQGVSSFAVGAGIAGVGGGVAGIVTVTELENATKAALLNSNVNANTVNINANHTGVVNAGNVSAGVGGVGAGVGISVGVLKDNSSTEVTVGDDENAKTQGSTNITAANDVNIAAENTAVVKPMISATGGAGVGAAVAGATSVNNLNSVVKTNVNNAVITSNNGNINGTANNTFNVEAYSGGNAIGGAGIGVGANVTVNTIDSTVQTNVNDSTLNAETGNVTLTADENRNITQFATNIAAGGIAAGANIAITSVGQEIKNTVNEDGETVSNAADKIAEANNAYGANDTETLLGDSAGALGTAGIDDIKLSVDAGYGGLEDENGNKISQITVNITNSNIDAGNNVTANATENDNINMTLGSGAAGAAAVNAGVGILNVNRNVGVNITGGSIEAGTVDIGTDIAEIDTDIVGNNEEDKYNVNLKVYQGSAGVIAANAAVGIVNTTGSSNIAINGVTITGKKVNIIAQDNSNTALQAVGVAAGAVALGALAAEANNDSDISVDIIDSAVTANGSTDDEGNITVETSKANEVTALAVNTAGGAIAGAGMGATVSDNGSSTIGLTGNTMQANNDIDVTAATNSKLQADIVNNGAGWFAAGAVSIAAVNAGNEDEDKHMVTSVNIGSGNTFEAQNTNVTAASNISESMDMDALAISGWGAASGNSTTSKVYADAVVTAEGYNIYKGANKDDSSDVSFKADNTVNQTAKTNGISAAGLFASGTNVGTTNSKLTTTVNIKGSDIEGTVYDSNINNLTAAANSNVNISNYVNGDGGALLDVSPYAAKTENSVISNTNVNIGGSWDITGNMDVKALHENEIDLNADALKAAVAGLSGVHADNKIENKTGVKFNDATVNSDGSQNISARNTIDYTNIVKGSGYGAANVTAVWAEDDLDLKTNVSIEKSKLNAEESITVDALTGDAGYNPDGEPVASVDKEVTIKSAGVIAGTDAISTDNIDFINNIKIDKDSSVATVGKEIAKADITFTAADRTNFTDIVTADTQGGVVGASGSVLNNNFNRENTITVEGTVDKDNSYTVDSNHDANFDAGNTSVLNLTLKSNAYNKTAAPIATNPTINGIMKQTSSINFTAGKAVESLRNINVAAGEGDTTIAKESKMWRWVTGGETGTGSIASTTDGTLSFEDADVKTTVNVDGKLLAGKNNELTITITDSEEQETALDNAIKDYNGGAEFGTAEDALINAQKEYDEYIETSGLKDKSEQLVEAQKDYENNKTAYDVFKDEAATISEDLAEAEDNLNSAKYQLSSAKADLETWITNSINAYNYGKDEADKVDRSAFLLGLETPGTDLYNTYHGNYDAKTNNIKAIEDRINGENGLQATYDKFVNKRNTNAANLEKYDVDGLNNTINSLTEQINSIVTSDAYKAVKDKLKAAKVQYDETLKEGVSEENINKNIFGNDGPNKYVSINASPWYKDLYGSPAQSIGMAEYASALLKRYGQLADMMQEYAGTEVSTTYGTELASVQSELQALGIGRYEDGVFAVTENSIVPTIELQDLNISGGDINISGGSLNGSGAMTANGNPILTIDNQSNFFLKVNDITVDNDGGSIMYNNTAIDGSYGGIDVNADTGVSGAQINISSSGNVKASESEYYTPDIGIFGTVSNPYGDITIYNQYNSIYVAGKVDGVSGVLQEAGSLKGRTVTLTAGGSVTQGYSDGITDVAGDPKNALKKDYIAPIQAALIDKLTDAQKIDNGKYYAAFNTVGELAQFLTGLKVGDETLSSARALEAAQQLTGQIDDGRAGITAGGAIYINAASINVNGKIQSGYEDYKLNLNQKKAQELISRGNTLGQENLPDAQFKTNEYLVTTEKNGAYYDNDTGKFVYGVKAWYNPTTGQIFTEDIEQAGGGRIYLTGAIANTNAGGKLIVLDGGSNYDINSTVKYMDNQFTLKLGSINAATVDGRIEINDTNTGQTTIYTKGDVTTDENDKRVATYNPKGGQYYIWSNGTANRVTVTYEHVSDTSWFGLSEDKWEETIGSLDEVTKDNMQVGITESKDEMLPTVGNIISDGSVNGYHKLDNVAGSSDKNAGTLYQIAFERKGKPKQGVNGDGALLYWDVDEDGNNILVTTDTGSPYYLKDANGNYIYKTVISDKVTTTENKDPLGWWGKTVTTRWKETSGMITAYNFGLKADNSIGIEFVGNETSTGKITSNSDILLGGDIHMGTVKIESTAGKIYHEGDATVISDNATFKAQTGIDVIVKNETNPSKLNATDTLGLDGEELSNPLHLKATTTSGNINIQAVAANEYKDVYIDNVSTGAGNVTITAEGSLLNGNIGTNGYAVKGDGINLQSYGGNIGSNEENGRLLIDGDVSYVADSDKSHGAINANAAGSVYLTEVDGHMYLGEIVAENGDVVLEVKESGAGFVDAIVNNDVMSESDQDRIAAWKEMGLLDDGTADAKLKLNSNVNQLKNLEAAAGNGSFFMDGKTTLTEAQEQGAKLVETGKAFVEAMKQNSADVQDAKQNLNAKQGALNKAISALDDTDASKEAYKAALTDYNEAYDDYGQSVAEYEQAREKFIADSGFKGKVQAEEWLYNYEAIGNAEADNYGWTQQQLLYAVQDTVINPAAGSVSDVKTANVTGNKITFISDTGNLGVVDTQETIIGTGELTNMFTKNIALTTAEQDKLDKLASARAGDVTWGKDEITIKRTTPVSVKLNGDNGKVTVKNTSGKTADYVYLLAKDSVLNADKFAANDLRLSGQQGINVNKVTGNKIILEGGSGDIGHKVNDALQAVQVTLTNNGYISANAAGNIMLEQVGTGNFTLGSVAGTNVDITANGNIVSKADDIGYINASDTINLVSAGGIGTDDEGLRIKNSGAVVNTNVQSAINIEAKQDGTLILGTIEQTKGGVTVESEGTIMLGREDDANTEDINESVTGSIDAKDDVTLHAENDIIISGKLHVNATSNDGTLQLHSNTGDIVQTTDKEDKNIVAANVGIAAVGGDVELDNPYNIIKKVDLQAVGGSLGLTVSNPDGFNVDMGGFTNKQGGDIKLTNNDGSVNITTEDIVNPAQKKDPANINGSLTVTADKLVEATKANVNNDGILNATGNISFNAEDNVNNEGALVAGRDVSFGAGNDIINKDIVDAGRNVNFNATENIYNNSTVNADETIEFTAVDGVINSDTVNGKDVIMQAIEQELENILAKDSVTLNGDRIHGQNITQNTEADGDLIINTDSNSGSGPIESLVIDKIDANDKSVFTELWAVEADITTVDDKMDFNDIMIEENAWLENSGTLATIYGNVPVKDDDANVHIYQSYPSMYVNFIDADTVETDGRLLSLDDYWYAYDQRFTAENHLRWQHGRYLDEDWKQAYGYGLSLHNRYGLIDYQEFTETNAGADEVAVEA